MGKGDEFGELGFFTGRPRLASAFSKEFSKAYKISRKEVLDLLNNFSDDKVKYDPYLF